MRTSLLAASLATLGLVVPGLPASADLDAGLRALKGKGEPKDAGKAFTLIGRAAKAGEAKAAYVLGVLYLKGQGVTASKEKAAEWFGRAAAQGHPDAAFHLARMHLKGAGAAKDPAKARELLGRASAKGHEKAKALLASLDAQPATGAGEAAGGKPPARAGTGSAKGPEGAPTRPPPKANPASGLAPPDPDTPKVDPSLEESLRDTQERIRMLTDSISQEYLDRSVADADKGVVWEQFCMGVRHEFGLKFPKDLAKAKEWYRKAWKGGYPLAETALAKLGP